MVGRSGAITTQLLRQGIRGHYIPLKVIVSQIGAREHYAVARALHQQRRLAGLITDWYAPGATLRTVVSCLGAISAAEKGRAALAARSESIPDELVRAFPFRSLFWKWRVRRLASQGRVHDAYVQTDRAFAAAAARLKLPSHDVFFGYSYASLEILAAEKRRGVLTVLDQIDPSVTEFRIVSEEMRQHPELAGPPPEFPGAYYERNRREWELADIILVNSEWSWEALSQQGVPQEKLVVVPLAYEAECGEQNSEFGPPRSGSLRVLWLGQANVRKGVHYLIEAARLLNEEQVHFDIVGPIGILPAAVSAAPSNMTFHGPVSRDRTAGWYRQSDIFVLPTLSDGFALTQLESFSHGLPVIATPNCGRVVEEGKTGFIVPPGDSNALADAILKFIRNPELRHTMADNCRKVATQYSLDSYGERLNEIIHERIRP